MSFFDEFKASRNEMSGSPTEWSEHVLLSQAANFRKVGCSVTALVLETVVKQLRVSGDKGVAEFFACLDEDILEECKDDIYGNYH